jgi:hypothetical protein
LGSRHPVRSRVTTKRGARGLAHLITHAWAGLRPARASRPARTGAGVGGRDIHPRNTNRRVMTCNTGNNGHPLHAGRAGGERIPWTARGTSCLQDENEESRDRTMPGRKRTEKLPSLRSNSVPGVGVTASCPVSGDNKAGGTGTCASHHSRMGWPAAGACLKACTHRTTPCASNACPLRPYNYT